MSNSLYTNADSTPFKVGWPTPPFFYKEYSRGSNSGRPPPEITPQIWRQYGVLYQTDFNIESLPSDVLLYTEDADLREEFRRLFFQYVESICSIADNLANQRGDDASKIKSMIKVYKNLLHILLRLRRSQAEDEVIKRLKNQLRLRYKSIDALKRALAEAKSSILLQPCIPDSGNSA